MGKEEMMSVARSSHERRIERGIGFCSGEERRRRMRGLNREMLGEWAGLDLCFGLGKNKKEVEMKRK